jgi:hypothetical protein
MKKKRFMEDTPMHTLCGVISRADAICSISASAIVVCEPAAIVVRAAGIEPAQAVKPYGFSYHFGFRRRASRRRALRRVRGLDYPFTLAPSRLRCCPSSLYTFAPLV